MFSGRMWVWMSIVKSSAMLRCLHEARVDLHHMSARPAGAQLLASVELPEPRKEVGLDVVQDEAVFMQQGIALLTVPLQPVLQFTVVAFHLDHHPDGSRRAARLVGRARRQQEHLPFPDRYGDRLPILLDAHFDVAFHLVEELLGLVPVIVLACIGTRPRSSSTRWKSSSVSFQ